MSKPISGLALLASGLLAACGAQTAREYGGGAATPSPATAASPATVTAPPSVSHDAPPTSVAIPAFPPPSLARPKAPGCTEAQLSFTTTSDAAQYAPGTAVVLTTTARNRGSAACSTSIDCNTMVLVDDESGASVVPGPKPFGHPCPSPRPLRLGPGEGTSVTQRWNQLRGCGSQGQTCPPSQVPAGAYTARGYWEFQSGLCEATPCPVLGPDTAPTVTFRIDGAPA